MLRCRVSDGGGEESLSEELLDLDEFLLLFPPPTLLWSSRSLSSSASEDEALSLLNSGSGDPDADEPDEVKELLLVSPADILVLTVAESKVWIKMNYENGNNPVNSSSSSTLPPFYEMKTEFEGESEKVVLPSSSSSRSDQLRRCEGIELKLRSRVGETRAKLNRCFSEPWAFSNSVF